MATHIKKNQIKSIKVDEATAVNRYGFATDAYDIVEIVVNGAHGTMMNSTSTKTYYITSGNAIFNIDNVRHQVGLGDIISVNPNSWLNIQGESLKALIICNPPFNPNDEKWK